MVPARFLKFLSSVPASIRDFVGGWVGPWVGPRKTLIILIGFQTANKNHSKSHEVADRVTMYVFTDRAPTVRAYTVSYTIMLASRARVGARAEVTRMN